MKKFLTVLLALSVVFTYTVGTAFAAGSDVVTDPKAEYEALVEQAAEQVSALATGDTFTEAFKSLTDYDPGLGFEVDAEFWKANADVFGDKLPNIISEKATEIKGLYEEHSDVLADKKLADIVVMFGRGVGENYIAGVKATKVSVPTTVTTIATRIKADKDVQLAVAKAYAEDLALNNTLSLKGIYVGGYSDAVNTTTGLSNVAMAQALVNNAVENIGTIDFAGAETIAEVKTLIGTLGAFGIGTFDAVTGKTLTENKGTGYLIDFVKLTDANYGIEKYVLHSEAKYEDQELVTKDDEEADANTLEAKKAALLAEVESKYADYLLGASADKAVAAAYRDGVREIINAAATLADLNKIFADATEIPAVSESFLTDKELIEDLVVFANKYIAEGYDAEGINDIVAQAKIDAYKDDADWKGLATAKEKIVEAVKAQFDTKKIDAEVALLEIALEDILEEDGDTGYYALEAEKVKDLYDTIIAAVKACTSDDELTKVKNKYMNNKADWTNPVGLNKIANKVSVRTTIMKTKTGDNGWNNNTAAVTAYGTSLNAGVVADQQRDFAKAGVFTADGTVVSDAWLSDFYAENGARTTAEAFAMIPDAKAALEAVPTKAVVNAAKEALEAQIAALPAATAITADDAAAVEAVKEAYDKFVKETKMDVSATAKLTLNKALTAAYNASKLALVKEMNAYASKDITAADKADLEALLEKASDFNKKAKEVYGKTLDDTDVVAKANTVKGYLTIIRNAAKKAVEKAIDALPLTVKEDNLALVDAAQKLYDEYVATYTDFYTELGDLYNPYSNFHKNAAEDFERDGKVPAELKAAIKAADKIKAEIAAAKKAAAIAAVEGMKVVKAHSAVGKGYIKVMWDVVGDETAIDGFQVYKSTKAQSGYTFMGKTTKHYMTNKKGLKKGKRFYYKVRAYKVIDGVKYFSDWSNKANRIYK